MPRPAHATRGLIIELLPWLLSVGVVCAAAIGGEAAPAVKAAQPRIVVLTDMGNEPDDSESIQRPEFLAALERGRLLTLPTQIFEPIKSLCEFMKAIGNWP